MKAEAIASMPGPRAKNALAERLKNVNCQRELIALASEMITTSKTAPETARAARFVYAMAKAGWNLLLMEDCLEEI